MSIRDLLTAKAHALAEEMGASATVLHLQAAAHHLSTELRRELDALIAEFRPAGTEVKPDPAPAAEAAPGPEEDRAGDVALASEVAPVGEDATAGDDAAAPSAVTSEESSS